MNYTDRFTTATKFTTFRTLGHPNSMPKYFIMSVTNMCNSRCKMCNVWKVYEKDRRILEDEMKLEEIRQFISTLKDSIISITGGEPCLRDDIKEIALSIIEKTGQPFTLITNALLPERIKNIVKDVKNIRLVISIEGFEQEHDSMRTVGSYKKAIGLLKWCLKNKIYVNTSTTICDYNFYHFPRFMEYLTSLGMPPRNILFRPVNSAEIYYHTDGNSLTKISDIVSMLQKLMRTHPELNSYFISRMKPFLLNGKRTPCYAGFGYCYIDPYWNIYPCPVWDYPLGNLRDTNFNLYPIWNSERAKEARKKVKRLECPNCYLECTAGLDINLDLVTGIKAFLKRKIF